MPHNRRLFLQALGAGIAIVSLPEVAPIFNWFGTPDTANEDLKSLLHRLLLGERPSGPFVAHADTYLIQGAPQKLLAAPAALLGILDTLGIKRAFSDRMDYTEASQCKGNFEEQEKTWRDNGFTSFSDVHRANIDPDVAVGVGGVIDNDRKLTYAMGASQYQQVPAVSLAGHDPTITLATRWLLDPNLTNKEIAQSMALTDKRDVAIDSGSSATRYETPVSSSVYIPRPRQNSGVHNAIGVVAANSKKDPSRIFFADLHT
jgi:hypothetical protein